MGLKIIGEHPLAKNDRGMLKSRIGTIFPAANTLVTIPGIHATQKVAFVTALNDQRHAEGQPPLTHDEEMIQWEKAVDLIMENDLILIRPDPDNMSLAFEADEILQELVSKQKIKFLQVTNEKVRQAIKERGECWRISPLPKSPDEMQKMIQDSRIGIDGRAIYFYNKMTGTRYVTFHEFARLDDMDSTALANQLLEILEYSARHNRMGYPEVDFFMAGEGFRHRDFVSYELLSHLRSGTPVHRVGQSLSIAATKLRTLIVREEPGTPPNDAYKTLLSSAGPDQVRTYYRELRARFEQAVLPEFRDDNLDNTAWRARMFSALIAQRDETISEEILRGLSSEFYMQIEWLPGGRFEDGELIFDAVFDELDKRPNDPELKALCDEKTRGFIFNFIREFGDVEYVNIGRVSGNISSRPQSAGRHDVYVAEIKQRGRDKPFVRMIQMQKWGIREHLDENKELFWSIIEAEEYTEYNLDRRFGCRQLGMNLPSRIVTRKISERYRGPRREYDGNIFWATYSERDYISGIATDKISSGRFANHEFALKFADLLGRAAAANIIAGRLNTEKKVLFDHGDEVVVEDENGLPQEIIVADHTGTFTDYKSDLKTFAADYAQPINRRIAFVPNAAAFAEAYLQGFVERFTRIQQEYRKRRRAFDTLFKHLRHDERGSFAYRWDKVLDRLDWTDPQAVADSIRHHLTLLR